MCVGTHPSSWPTGLTEGAHGGTRLPLPGLLRVTSIALGPVRRWHLDDSPLYAHSSPKKLLDPGDSQMTKTTLPSRNIQAGGHVALTHATHSPGPGAPLSRSPALLQRARSCQTELTGVSKNNLYCHSYKTKQINWPLSLYKVWGIRPPGLPPFLP